MKKDVLRNFAKFTGKHLCNFIKKEILAQEFSYKFWEISKNTSFTEQLWWLLIYLGNALRILWKS